jgi:hypothetical protein
MREDLRVRPRACFGRRARVKHARTHVICKRVLNMLVWIIRYS